MRAIEREGIDLHPFLVAHFKLKAIPHPENAKDFPFARYLWNKIERDGRAAVLALTSELIHSAISLHANDGAYFSVTGNATLDQALHDRHRQYRLYEPLNL